MYQHELAKQLNYHFIAQLAEHLTLNQRVQGSIPCEVTYAPVAQMEEHRPSKASVEGSIPFGGAIGS